MLQEKVQTAESASRTTATKSNKASKVNTPDKVQISPPNFQQAAIKIRGTAPLVMHAFSAKTQAMMEDTQRMGSQAKKGKKRDPKNFDELYERARHIAKQGWDGIPATAFRNSMIAACRTVGFAMTISKLSVFVVADGYDRESGQPLVKITKGKPRQHRGPVRNASGVVDIRARPMWDEWEAIVRVRWDGDQFSPTDVVNLLARAGNQVGLCEGRPGSTNSAGCGWGTFEVLA